MRVSLFFVIALTGTYNLSGTDIILPDDYGALKNMGDSHSYKYVLIPEKPAPTRQTPALWTNTNPTNTFGETTVTLTESIESCFFFLI